MRGFGFDAQPPVKSKMAMKRYDFMDAWIGLLNLIAARAQSIGLAEPALRNLFPGLVSRRLWRQCDQPFGLRRGRIVFLRERERKNHRAGWTEGSAWRR